MESLGKGAVASELLFMSEADEFGQNLKEGRKSRERRDRGRNRDG